MAEPLHGRIFSLISCTQHFLLPQGTRICLAKKEPSFHSFIDGSRYEYKYVSEHDRTPELKDEMPRELKLQTLGYEKTVLGFPQILILMFIFQQDIWWWKNILL